MLRKAVCSVIVSLSLAASGHAAETSDGGIVAREVLKGTTLAFEVKGWPPGARGVMLRIEGPRDYLVEENFGGSVPEIDLAKYGKLRNGFYDYEIRGGTGERVRLKEPVNNGRGKKDVAVEFVTFVLAGRVRVAQGQLLELKPRAENKSEKPVVGEETGFDTDTGNPPPPGPGDPPGGGEDVKDSDG